MKKVIFAILTVVFGIVMIASCSQINDVVSEAMNEALKQCGKEIGYFIFSAFAFGFCIFCLCLALGEDDNEKDRL